MYGVLQISCLAPDVKILEKYRRKSSSFAVCQYTDFFKIFFKDFSDKCCTTSVQNRTEHAYFCKTSLGGCFRKVCKTILLSLIRPSLCPFLFSKFTGEHPCRSVISIKFQSSFIEITLWQGCSPVNLLYIFKHLF